MGTQQAAVLDAGGLSGLLTLLAAAEPARREGAADALAALLSGSSAAASQARGLPEHTAALPFVKGVMDSNCEDCDVINCVREDCIADMVNRKSATVINKAVFSEGVPRLVWRERGCLPAERWLGMG